MVWYFHPFKNFPYLLWPTQSNGEGNGTLLQYSCLENPMDGGAWCAAVHEVAKSRTWLSDFTFTFHSPLSCIGEGNGNPLRCSCLENPRDNGAWWAAVSGVAQSRTRLNRLSSSNIVKVFWVVSEEEVDIFWNSLLYNPTNVDSLTSGSSAFSKPSLYTWKFSGRILLKSSLKDFEHYLTSVWNVCNRPVVERSLAPLTPSNSEFVAQAP